MLSDKILESIIGQLIKNYLVDSEMIGKGNKET